MTKRTEHPDSPGQLWWNTPGSLRTCLLRLDGQVGAIINAEKHMGDPAVVSGEVAGQLERIAQQMGLRAGDEAVEPLSSVRDFGSVKPGFTREAGSFRRQEPPRGLPDPARRATP